MIRELLGDDFHVGVGVDCEEVDRWRKLLPNLESGPQRSLFHPEEHAYCRSFPDAAAQYAGRWCAKEAVFKAVSAFCTLSLRDIRILNMEDGRPYAVVSAPDFARVGARVRVSISHSARTAMAFVVALVARGSAADTAPSGAAGEAPGSA